MGKRIWKELVMKYGSNKFYKKMFENLNGKRLLYLGGIPRAKYVVERAKKLGIYVIVADYNENSPAKLVADEGILVDAVDVPALVLLCKKKKIDGIMTAYVDILMPVCRKVADELGIPYYATETMLQASTDKEFFKEMCLRYNVPVPKTYDVTVEDYVDKSKNLPYPIFVKPLDGSGSRGANMCSSPEDFVEKFEYALSYSQKKCVTVEDFLSGTEFILDYMIVDGEPYLQSFADRYSIEGRNAAVNHPNLMILPSKNLSRYKEIVDSKVKEMFRKEGFRDGVIFLQGYADERDCTFYEMGCRLGGTWPYIAEHFNEINPMDMLFSHALTGNSVTPGYKFNISADFAGKAAIIYFLSEKDSGTVDKIFGINEVKELPYVVSAMQYYHEGDSFDMNRKTDVLFLAVHLVAENFDELKERINHVYSLVAYYDNKGESLLSPLFDVNKLEGYK